MTGNFIVFEGPDASGTTRHSELLAERMRTENIAVLLTSEPTGGHTGKHLRSLLRSEAPLPPPAALQLLFTADRAEHVQTCIEPALRSGKTVISDRYALSTLIYGAAFGLDATWLRQLNRTFPPPDLTIITLPPFEVCMERMARRENRDQFEQETFQRKIYDAYANVQGPAILTIDTSAEKEIVAEGIWKKVQAHFGPIARERIATL